jgi:hypothetical protein
VAVVVGGTVVIGCGNSSKDDAAAYRPTKDESRFLAAVAEMSGKDVAQKYQRFFACGHAANIKVVVPKVPIKRVEFSYTIFPFDKDKLRKAGEVCRPFAS